MTNITVQTINSTLVIDSRLIAAELGIEHKSFKQLIKTYQVDFEEFGNLSISNAGVVGTSSYAEFCYLNEDQAYLALTFVKNTLEARKAKKNLVHAFKIAREALAPKMPVTMIEYVEAHLTALKEAEATKLLLAASNEKVAELKPKADAFNILCESNGAITIGDLSKVIGVKELGPKNIFKFLRNGGVLTMKNLPMQKHLHLFNVVEKYDSYRNTHYLVPLVNAIGQEYIIDLVLKAGHRVTSKLINDVKAASKAEKDMLASLDSKAA